MIANPYANVDIYMPEDIHGTILQFVGNGRPFPRQIDAWWLGLCLGVRAGQRRPIPREKSVKFITGVILGSNAWRITQLELIAVAEEGEEILRQASSVIRLASEYANFGLEWVKEHCLGATDPILNLLNACDPETLEF